MCALFTPKNTCLSTTDVAPPSPHTLLVQSTAFTLAARDRVTHVVTLLFGWLPWSHPAAVAQCTASPWVPPPSRFVGPLTTTVTWAWSSLRLANEGTSPPIAVTTFDSLLTAPSQRVGRRGGPPSPNTALGAALPVCGGQLSTQDAPGCANGEGGWGETHAIRMVVTTFQVIHLILYHLWSSPSTI